MCSLAREGGSIVSGRFLTVIVKGLMYTFVETMETEMDILDYHKDLAKLIDRMNEMESRFTKVRDLENRIVSIEGELQLLGLQQKVSKSAFLKSTGDCILIFRIYRHLSKRANRECVSLGWFTGSHGVETSSSQDRMGNPFVFGHGCHIVLCRHIGPRVRGK